MFPRWHTLFGGIFTIILWFFVPSINWVYLVLLFLSSFLIDFDHYMASLIKTRRWRLKDSLEYHKEMLAREKEDKRKGIKKKSDFHLFHTIEFHFLIGLLGIFFASFFYIFIGMTFHSLLDVADLLFKKSLHTREFFFFNWIAKRV